MKGEKLLDELSWDFEKVLDTINITEFARKYLPKEYSNLVAQQSSILKVAEIKIQQYIEYKKPFVPLSSVVEIFFRCIILKI